MYLFLISLYIAWLTHIAVLLLDLSMPDNEQSMLPLLAGLGAVTHH